MKKNKPVTILLIIGFLLSSFNIAFAQEENEKIQAPGTFEEIRNLGKKFLEAIPKALEAVWQVVVGIWKGMWNWCKNIWNSYIFPFFQNIWHKICDFFRICILERFKRIME